MTFYDGSPRSRGIINLTNQLSFIEMFLEVLKLIKNIPFVYI